MKIEHEKSKALTLEQMTAISKAIVIGRQLQLDVPEILGDYRQGMFQSAISKKYQLESRYGINEKVAVEAVRIALSGHPGGFNKPAFEGLIQDKEELERLCEDHRISSGTRLYEEGRGIYGMDIKLREEAQVRGARTSGKKNYENKLGFFGWGKEQKTTHAKKAGKKGGLAASAKAREGRYGIFAMTKDDLRAAAEKANLARGFPAWTDEERENAYNLSLIAQSQYPDRKTRFAAITYDLNMLYHQGRPVRTPGAVYVMLFYYKKTKA